MGNTVPVRRRWWAFCVFGRNPLIRSSDRVEVGLLAVMIAIVVLAIPVALAFATGVHDSRSRALDAVAPTSHEVTATLVGDTVTAVKGYTLDVTAKVAWQVNNREHTASVDVPRQMPSGAQLQIWVDDTGRLAAPPQTPATATRDAVLAGVGAWIGVIGCAALIFVLTRMRLNRMRAAGWDREFRHLVDDEGGRADWRN